MTAEAPAIEDLARDWLSAERSASARGEVDDERSRIASALYDEAVRSASREELLVAWHAALRRQDEADMGSVAWAEARTVSQLLAREYAASD
jgi:hypothetical protein